MHEHITYDRILFKCSNDHNEFFCERQIYTCVYIRVFLFGNSNSVFWDGLVDSFRFYRYLLTRASVRMAVMAVCAIIYTSHTQVYDYEHLNAEAIIEKIPYLMSRYVCI